MLKSNNIRQLLAFIIIMAGLVLTVTIAVRMSRKAPHDPASAQRVPTADVTLNKIHYTETRQGKKQWDLVADKAEHDLKKDLTRLTGVRLTVAGDRKTGDLSLTADHADYHTKTGDVELAGNVKAWNSAGMTFTSATAAYVAAESLIRTADPVKFSNGSLTVEGTGMMLATDTKTLRIDRQVTATFTPGKRTHD
jgi:LPS export ABC transporter protein LptC